MDSSRISIRPFEPSDADDFLTWASDDKVTRFLRWNTMTSVEEALNYIQEVAMPHPFRHSICLDDRSIGYVAVKPKASDIDRHRAHISYAIGSDHWGRGIVTSALKVAVSCAFEKFPFLVRLEALVEEENVGSQRVLEKVGFRKEGLLRKYGFNKGEIRDMLIYSFLKTDKIARKSEQKRVTRFNSIKTSKTVRNPCTSKQPLSTRLFARRGSQLKKEKKYFVLNKMEKLNFVRDGEIKLPPGFRFQPTDEEIVFQYLARKVFSHPLPASVIPEINIFSFDPWELPGGSEQERYFFTNMRADYRNINRMCGATCDGYWKSSTGSDKQVICSERDIPIVGIKKTMVFYKGRQCLHASRTDWIMNVYCISLAGSRACNNVYQHNRNCQGSSVQIGDWVLCHVFLKKRNGREEQEEESDSDHRLIRGYDTSEADRSDDADSSSSSCADSDSSALTEVSSSIN